MEINIISFGKISEIVENQTVNIDRLEDTDQVKTYLEQRYPALTEIKYTLALNKTLVQESKAITGHATIAIMPPFSGG